MIKKSAIVTISMVVPRCEGGTLASFTNQSEMEEARDVVRRGSRTVDGWSGIAWIGYYDGGKIGEWAWADGARKNESFESGMWWRPQQPKDNSICKEQRCAGLAPDDAPPLAPKAGVYSYACGNAATIAGVAVTAAIPCLCTLGTELSADWNATASVLETNDCENPYNAMLVFVVCLILTAVLIAVFCVLPLVNGTYGLDASTDMPPATISEKLGGEGIEATEKRVDTSALTGLRGVAALHVALGHHFAFTTLKMVSADV